MNKHAFLSSACVLYAFLFTSVCFGSLPETPSSLQEKSDTPPLPEEKPKEQSILTPEQSWLIIGGTRDISYALAKTLEHKKTPYTLFVRQESEQKARALFKKEYCTLCVGDISHDDPKTYNALKKAAEGKTHYFVNQIFPYNVWEKSTRTMIKHVITLAQENKATIVCPSRIYSCGKQSLIKESNPLEPVCEQGRVLADIEDELKKAATNGCCVRILRHSFPFGPAVEDGLLSENFKSIATARKNKKLTSTFNWIASDKVSFQLSYTPDLAKAILAYTQLPLANAFDVLNYPGHTYKDLIEFVDEVSTITGIECAINCYSSWKLSIASALNSRAKRGYDIFYSFEDAYLLDETRFTTLLPNWKQTPLSIAINKTVSFYHQNIE